MYTDIKIREIPNKIVGQEEKEKVEKFKEEEAKVLIENIKMNCILPLFRICVLIIIALLIYKKAGASFTAGLITVCMSKSLVKLYKCIQRLVNIKRKEYVKLCNARVSNLRVIDDSTLWNDLSHFSCYADLIINDSLILRDVLLEGAICAYIKENDERLIVSFDGYTISMVS